MAVITSTTADPPVWLLHALIANAQLPHTAAPPAAGGTPTIRQIVTAAGNGVSAVATLGAGTAIGDLLVVFDGNDFNTAANLPNPSFSQTVSGLTLQATGDQGTNGNHVKVWTAGVTVAGTQTVTCATSVSGEEVSVHVYVIDGTTIDLAAFLDGAAGSSGAAGTTTMDAPSVSPTTSNALLICCVLTGAINAGSFTPPGGMTERTDFAVGAAETSSTATQVLSASGPTGAKTFTFVTTSNGGYASASIAIKGVTAGGGDISVNDTTNPTLTHTTGDPTVSVAITDGTAPATTHTTGNPTPGVASTDTNPALAHTTADPAIAAAVNDSTNPQHTLVAGDPSPSVGYPDVTAPAISHTTSDVTATQTTTDGTAPALTHTTGDPAPSVATNDSTAPAITHQTFDATTSTAVLVNVNAELTNHTVVTGDPIASLASNAELTNHAQTAGDASAGVGVPAGAGTTSHTTGDALAGVSATDSTAPATTHTTSAPAPSIAVNAGDAATTHTTYDATTSTAVIVNVNAPDLVHTITTGDPAATIGAPIGAPATTHQTFDVAGQISTSANAAAGATSHTTSDPQASIGGSPQSALHSFVTGDVTATQDTTSGSASNAHTTYDATVATTTAPPAFVSVEAGSRWDTADAGQSRVSISDVGTTVRGMVG